MGNIMEITSLSAPELAVFTRLTEAQLRSRLEPQMGVFIAESPKVIRLALDAGYQPVSFLMERKHIDGQAKPLLARCPACPVYTADREVLSQLTGYSLTRGILCAMRRPAQKTAAQVCDGVHRVAVLEGIVDATNIGAIFRSAAALAIDAVLLSTTCCDPLNRRAVRVSMGTVFQIPWAFLEDFPGLRLLSNMGFRTAAMALRPQAISIADPALSGLDKLAILLGTEGDGLSQQTIDACDYVVKIPMSHGVDSLNVAAASAVAFWQLQWP